MRKTLLTVFKHDVLHTLMQKNHLGLNTT